MTRKLPRSALESSRERTSNFAAIGLLWVVSACLAAEPAVPQAGSPSETPANQAAGELATAQQPGAVQRTRDPVPSDGPAIQVAGVVVTVGGRPIPGASVALRAKIGGQQYWFGLPHNRDILARTTADDQGRFEFHGIVIPPRLDDMITSLLAGQGGVELFAWADGWGAAWLDVSGLAGDNEFQLTLQREADITGQVQDTAGQSVPGVRITVVGATHAADQFDALLREPGDLNWSLSELCFTTTTDARGRFRLRHLQPDCRWLIILERAGYGREVRVVDTGARVGLQEMRWQQLPRAAAVAVVRSPLAITLKRSRFVEVRVVDDQGRPVDSGAVEVSSAEGDFAGREEVNSQGLAQIERGQPGRYEFAYSNDPLQPRLGTSVAVQITDDTNTPTIEIRLPTARWVTGQVVDDETGQGVVGAYLEYTQCDEDPPKQPTAFAIAASGPDGRFRIPVATGPGTLSFAYNIFGYLPPSVENCWGGADPPPPFAIEIPETGPLESVRLRVSRGLAIRGTLRDQNGQPVASVLVRAENTDRPFRQAVATTDAQGRFQMTGLSPCVDTCLTVAASSRGTRQVIPAAPGHPWDRTRRAEDIDLVLQPGITLAGRVRKGDRPLAGVRMRLYRTLPGESKPYALFSETLTDAEGCYRAGGLAVGDGYYFDIIASDGMLAPGWEHQMSYAPEIREGSPSVIELPDAVLVTCAQNLRGIVVDPRGKPVTGVSVVACIADGPDFSRPSGGPPTSVETDPQGRFELHRLPDRPIELTVYRASPRGGVIRFVGEVQVRPQLNQDDIRVVFDPSLTEEIEDLNAAPVVGEKKSKD